MGRKYLDALNELAKGHHLTADEMNALIRGLKTQRGMEKGFRCEGLDVSKELHVARSKWIVATTDEDAANEYGIIGPAKDLAADHYGDEPFTVWTSTVHGGQNGSPLLGLTVGEIEQQGDRYHYVRPVNDFEPTKLRAYVSNLPKIGHPCGIRPGSDMVEADRYGFVCLAVGQDDGGYYFAWVMRSDRLANVVGVVTTAAPGFDYYNNILGKGELRMYWRDSSDDGIELMSDPESHSTPWIVPFYNICPDPVPQGYICVAHCCISIGLVAIQVCGPVWEGSSASSSRGAEGSSSSAWASSSAADEEPTCPLPDKPGKWTCYRSVNKFDPTVRQKLVHDANPPVELEVAASGDDGYWIENADEVFDDDAGVIHFGRHADAPANAFVSFDNLSIPPGAVIHEAYLSVTAEISLKTGLENYWELDDETATVGQDFTEVGTVTYDTGKIGDCAECPSGDNHLEIAHADVGNLSGGAHDWTLSFWFASRAGGSSSTRALCGMGKMGVNLSKEYVLYHIANDDDVWIRSFDDGRNADDSSKYNVPGGINTGEWHHVVLRNVHGTGLELIIDGDLAGSVSTTNPETQSASGPFCLGSAYYTDAAKYPWAGNVDIDEAAFWYRALTDEEILQLYNDGDAITHPFSALLTETPLYADVCLVDEDDATVPSDYDEAQGKSRTVSVAWDVEDSWTENDEYVSPNLRRALQEVIDRPGWSENNRIVLLLEDAGTTGSGIKTRQARSFDHADGSPPSLWVSWWDDEHAALRWVEDYEGSHSA